MAAVEGPDTVPGLSGATRAAPYPVPPLPDLFQRLLARLDEIFPLVRVGGWRSTPQRGAWSRWRLHVGSRLRKAMGNAALAGNREREKVEGEDDPVDEELVGREEVCLAGGGILADHPKLELGRGGAAAACSRWLRR